jgi:hypothetical protein
MDMTLWEDVLLAHCHDLREAGQTMVNQVRRERVAIIVEPRSHHPLLEACVRNCMAALGEGWNLEIHTYDPAFVATKFPGSSITFVQTPENYTRYDYSQLLMSKSFWERIKEEMVCIFQTDVVFFRPIPESYLVYDYAGANYFSPDMISRRIGGIQGGFSLRRREAMLDCIARIEAGMVSRYLDITDYKPIHEDVFFTIACDLLDKKVPDVHERTWLAIESNYYDTPCAMHGFNCDYFSYAECVRLIQKSPLLEKYY